MPRKAMKRVETESAAPTKQRPVWGLAAQGKRKKELDDLGPILRISRQDIITLRDLCASEGSPKVAADIGLSEQTLLRAMAGLGERCIPRSTHTLQDFLHKLNN